MSGIECPRCSLASDAAARFCEACGTALPRACPDCGHVGGAGARFCAACGRPLDAAAGGGARRSTYTPRHLAEKILTQRSALEGERKQVTVLFADLKGSMEIAAEIDPEEWHAIMDRFFAIASEGVHRHEGTINQFTGDGVMALFGAPLAHEDHAERACHAALALARALARYGEELRREQGLGFAVRIGLNSGEVVVGRIGDDLRMDYTAQGHTVGLAARMEQLADPGRIYLTEHTARLVAGRFRLRDLGRHNVRGGRGALGVFELEGIGALRDPLAVSFARGFTTFVGRTGEGARLEAALDRAVAGGGTIAAVAGEAGVGKSRLCFEIAARARARGIAVHEAHAVPYGRAVPFLPAQQLLRSLFGIDERDDAEESRRKIAGTLLLLDPGLHEELPLVFELLGVADPGEGGPAAGSPEARQRRLLAVVRRLLSARAARAPQVLLVEDVHWIDPGSEAFLTALAEEIPSSRALLLLNFRPEYRASWLDRRPVERIALAPLEPAASDEVLAELLGRDASLDELARRIGERAGGNPFFIEEMVRALAEGGHLAGERGAYRLAGDAADPVLPATVQAVLAARIDRLAEADKEVLHTAAVIGKRFARGVLQRVVGQPEEAVAAALGRLVAAALVRPDEAAAAGDESFAFEHPLTQEVAYRSQLGAQRERVHARVAAVLEELHGAGGDAAAALLAHHHERAGDRLSAARWAQRAAERAMRSDVAETVRWWRKASELAASLPETEETRAIGVWAGIQVLNLGWRAGLTAEEARQLFESGVALAKRTGDPSAASGFLVTYGAVQGLAGRPEEAVTLITEAARLAREAGDEATVVATTAALAQAQNMRGRLREAIVTLDAAVALTEERPGLGNEQTGFDNHVWCLALRGSLRTETGALALAQRDIERALEMARARGEAETLGWALEMRASLARWQRDREGACGYARASVEIAERLGSPFSQSSAYGTLGLALRQLERWDEAAAALEHALDVIRTRRTFLHWEAASLAALAEIYAARGEVDRALEAAREALQLARTRGTSFIELLASVSLARVLRRSGGSDRDQVASLLLRGDALVDQTGAETWRALVHLERARLAGDARDEAACRSELERARASFAAIGAVELAGEVKGLLAAGFIP